MGVYDRDYYRDEPGGFFSSRRRSAVFDLILINVVVYVVDILLDYKLNELFSLKTDLFTHPWQCYQLITSGFLHDPRSIGHILFNMLALFFFGREVEGVYGRKRFLQLYFTGLIISGLMFVVAQMAAHSDAPAVGASGAIMAVAVLFGLNFPNTTIYVNFFIPVPAWLMVIIYVLWDLKGVLGIGARDEIAHSAHLGGAVYGFLFYRTGWTLFNLWPGKWSLAKLKPRPSLRVHTENSDEPEDPRLWQAKVDAILEKISKQGEASLSADERKILEEASRRYQQRRGR